MKRIVVIIVLIFLCSSNIIASPIKLSSKSRISVITADPGQEELYTAFGHSAIRVFDPENQIDYAFNYGVFDFEQPNFYLNFTKGHLNYMLGVSDFKRWVYQYEYYNRTVFEQELDLSQEQKQAIVDFLTNNALPENKFYLYDYFYDNCASRVWNVFENVFKEDLIFDEKYVETGHTFRTFVDSLTLQQPWGDFGIDLCLGLPIDKYASAHEYMFLPEFVRRSLEKATLKGENGFKPIVKKSTVYFQSQPKNSFVEGQLFTPNLVFWSLLVVVVIITFLGYRKNKIRRGIDVTLFGIFGLIGVFLFALWVATDHKAASNNMNLLWAIPLHLPVAILLLKKKKPSFLKPYFLFTAVLMVLLVILWKWIPQGYNAAFMPIALTLGVRAFYEYYWMKKQRI